MTRSQTIRAGLAAILLGTTLAALGAAGYATTLAAAQLVAAAILTSTLKRDRQ